MRVNMKNMINYEETDQGIQLYFSDGMGYYWERAHLFFAKKRPIDS